MDPRTFLPTAPPGTEVRKPPDKYCTVAHSIATDYLLARNANGVRTTVHSAATKSPTTGLVLATHSDSSRCGLGTYQRLSLGRQLMCDAFISASATPLALS